MCDRLAPCLFLILIFAMTCPLVAGANEDSLSHLDFEECGQPEGLAPWGGGPPETLGLEADVVRTGKYAGRIVRDAGSPREFSTITTSASAGIVGKRLEFVGWVRTKDVDGWAGFWLREDGPSGVVQFTNMQRNGLSGTNDWTECRLELPLDAAAEKIMFGVILAGTGQVWADDLELLVDGRPYVEAPKRAMIPTVIDLDQEFNERSGLTNDSVEPWRVESLVLMGKVWGFLKYHHPLVTGGERHWDFDLFRGLTAVLAAPDEAAAGDSLTVWALSLGEPAPCAPCAGPPAADAHLIPDLDWLDNSARLGTALAAYLLRVHAARPMGPQFYVETHIGVGNPKLSHEEAYSQFDIPDTGYRLLALYRFWNIIEYWFPNRDIIGEDWDAVLAAFVPRFVESQGQVAYDRELLALIARVHDTHANKEEAHSEYALDLIADINGRSEYDCIIGAVPHTEYLDLDASGLSAMLNPGGLLADLKGMWRNITLDENYRRWEL